MHTRILVPILAFACAISQAQAARAQAPAPELAKPAEVASVPPPAGWKCMVAFGSAKRLPFAPPANKIVAMLPARPMQTVLTSGEISCIVS